jgi:hypothetical protein
MNIFDFFLKKNSPNAIKFKQINRRAIFKNFSILFEDIFREIEAFFIQFEGFSKITCLFKYIFSGIDVFLK